MKKLGNIKKRGLHKHATTDLFAAGNQLLKKSLKKQRKRILHRRHTQFQLTIMAMKYHDAQLQHRSNALEARMKEKKCNSRSDVKRSWETEYKEDTRKRTEMG